MAVVQELIRTEDNGTISFGDYELNQKSKLSDYQYQGDMYKVKTYKEITKLERNGMFVYESVPGTSVFHLQQDGTAMSFEVQGFEDSQITVELEAETEYQVFIDGCKYRYNDHKPGRQSFLSVLNWMRTPKQKLKL